MKDRYKSDLLYVYPGIIVLDERDKNASMCLTRNNVTDIFLNFSENMASYQKDFILMTSIWNVWHVAHITICL